MGNKKSVANDRNLICSDNELYILKKDYFLNISITRNRNYELKHFNFKSMFVIHNYLRTIVGGTYADFVRLVELTNVSNLRTAVKLYKPHRQ